MSVGARCQIADRPTPDKEGKTKHRTRCAWRLCKKYEGTLLDLEQPRVSTHAGSAATELSFSALIGAGGLFAFGTRIDGSKEVRESRGILRKEVWG
jgi:hypothetical protein